MQIRVADYIAQFLADRGVRHVFMVTGGGAMHLNDAFGYEPRMEVFCNHHEQACAMAAEGYARISGGVGVLNVTTGPGGINAINGVFGAWTDSIPMIVVSGQVKRELCVSSYSIPGLRQLGDQEVDIIGMVKGITKYAVSVTDPQSIRKHLEKAWYLACSGRPGPCWIDVPIDVQAAMVAPEILPGCNEEELACPGCSMNLAEISKDVLRRIREAKRPVILAGKGLRLAGCLPDFEKAARRLNIPVVTGWQAIDLLPSDDPLYCGRPGDLGDRAGNFTVQNSDLLLVLGCRLSIRHTSHNWQAFARHAFKIQVDADAAELCKPTVKIDLPVNTGVDLFIEALNSELDMQPVDSRRHEGWLSWCKERVRRYPVVLPRHREMKDDGRINPYHFIETFFQCLSEDDVVACGDGTANVAGFQAAWIKKGQRVFCNTGDASMGYDLPAAIGAAVARHGKRVVCLAGDGSIQMNIQELQTVAHHRLPLKIFVLNNDGYLSIRTSQSNFFKRLVGEGPKSGVTFPDMVKLATSYGLKAIRIQGKDFAGQIREALAYEGSIVCDVMLDSEQTFEPKISSRKLADGRMVSAPLEDMFPFLSREELAENLFFKPLED